MKKIDFWTPYIGNVGTIKATIHSAEAIKKYSKEDIEISLFKIHSEWENYEDSIKKTNLNIVNFNLKKYFKNLPKYGLMYRFTMIIIMLYSIPKLIKYFNQEKPDIVIAYLQGITPLIARKFSKYKPKIVLSIQGLPDFLAKKEVYNSYPFYKKIESKLRVWLWKKIYLKANTIIALTQKTTDELNKILNTDKVIYIPNPIVDEEEIIIKSKEKVEEQLFLGNDYILGIGRLSKQKDFATLIKAFKLVNQYYKDLKLIILGEGELREELEKLISDMELENKVILYGFVDNPYKYLKNAKIFVLSSLWEDQGHALVEATYLKIPCVSTKCPSGQEELLSYGKAGYLCNVGDDKEMADKILKALNNDNKNKGKLAYENSLKFTEKEFYSRIIKCL